MSWICLFFLPFVVLASETDLETIEVQARKDVGRFTFTRAETISEQDFEKQPLNLISHAIENVPGLVANQNGGPGGRVSFFVRGTESRHVSFTIDGLKINDPSNTDRQFDAAFFMSPFIKSIIVFKGPQAVLYGSDAMGGLVDVRTKKGENAPETKLTITGGSFATLSSSLAYDWQSKSSRGTLTATRFHTDGISRLNHKRYRAKEKDATDITQITSSSAHKWNTKIETEILSSFTNGKAEQDGFASDNSKDFSRNDQYLLQQKTQLEIDSTQAISLRNGFNRHQRLNSSVSVGNEFFNGELLQNEFIYQKDLKSLSLLSGIASEHESAKAINLNRSFDLHSGFLQTSYAFNKLRLHAGVRADKHTNYGSFYTGSGGVELGDFSFQYSQGYKAPTLYQLYGPVIFGSAVGNPDLLPETNHYSDLSWKKKNERFETSVALFQNRLSNLVTFAFGRGYFNQQRFISEGIELSTKGRWQKLEAYASVTHQNFRKELSPVLRRPENLAQLGFNFFLQDTLEINLNSRWFSSRKDIADAGEVVKLNPYEVVDLGIRKSWFRYELSLQIKNIFKRKYEELYGFNVLPRSVFAGYAHRFH